MPSLQVRLVRSWAGTPERHRRTLEGLGLYKIDDQRVLPDTAATLGMIRQVGHLVTFEHVTKDHKAAGRRATEGKKTGPQAGKKKS
jgi:large subunit ribosomal protein L30